MPKVFSETEAAQGLACYCQQGTDATYGALTGSFFTHRNTDPVSTGCHIMHLSDLQNARHCSQTARQNLSVASSQPRRQHPKHQRFPAFQEELVRMVDSALPVLQGHIRTQKEAIHVHLALLNLLQWMVVKTSPPALVTKATLALTEDHVWLAMEVRTRLTMGPTHAAFARPAPPPM